MQADDVYESVKKNITEFPVICFFCFSRLGRHQAAAGAAKEV
jgi:hypothetical protein